MAQLSSFRTLQVSTGIGVGLMLLKFAAWAITDSTAILTDALESIVNVVAAFFALYSLRLASIPSDENHPYGHGKIEFFSAGLEGLLILGAAIGITFKAVQDLIHPDTLASLGIGAAMVISAGVANGGLGIWLMRTGKREESLILVADGKHLLTDFYSSLGLGAGLLVMHYTGLTWLDPVVALAMALLIGRAGVRLVLQAYAGLMDEADLPAVDELIQALSRNRKANWIDVHNLRVQRYGSGLHMDAHLTLPNYLPLSQVHDEIAEIEAVVNRELGRRVEVFLHTDPCIPECCPHCTVHNCPIRSAAFRADIPWMIDTVVPNRKHALGLIQPTKGA
jgi:cation diffusion facilitator family transporter